MLEQQITELKLANLSEITRLQARLSNRTLIESGTVFLFAKQTKIITSFSARIQAIVQSVCLPQGKLTSSIMKEVRELGCTSSASSFLKKCLICPMSCQRITVLEA